MPIDFVTALGKLLTSPDLQACYQEDPHKVAEQLSVDKKDRGLFTTLSPAQVHTQSRLLITKRMHEVYKHLPLTCGLLSNQLAKHFTSYAVSYWPKGRQRHQEDAYHFASYLKKHKLTYNQSELNKLRFLRGGHRLRLFLARDALMQGKQHPAIQLFYKNKKRHGEWRFYLKA